MTGHELTLLRFVRRLSTIVVDVSNDRFMAGTGNPPSLLPTQQTCACVEQPRRPRVYSPCGMPSIGHSAVPGVVRVSASTLRRVPSGSSIQLR